MNPTWDDVPQVSPFHNVHPVYPVAQAGSANKSRSAGASVTGYRPANWPEKAYRAGAVAFLAALCVFLAALPAQAQTVREWVTTLASEDFGGRMTGSPDERKASAYIIQELGALGVQPLPGEKDLLHPFPFALGIRDFGSTFSVQAEDGITTEFKAARDSMVANFSPMGKTEAPLAVLGINLQRDSPDDLVEQELRRHDISGKIVAIIGGIPPARWKEHDYSDPPVIMARKPTDWAETAALAGAKGILIHAPSMYSKKIEQAAGLVEGRADETPIPGYFIAARCAEKLINLADHSIDPESRAALARGSGIGAFFHDTETTAVLDVRMLRTTGTAQNIVGFLPANSGDRETTGAIVIGAHYDHVGDSTFFSGIELAGKRGPVHYGADDNASGVAAVLSIAQRLSVMRRTRPIVIALWSGEELGLIGSRQFVKEPPIDLDEVLLYINFDMVGRMRENTVEVYLWPMRDEITERLLKAGRDQHLVMKVSERKWIGSDHTSFTSANIPSVSFFTGLHSEYHTPKDTADTINFEGIEKIAAMTINFLSGDIRGD